MPYPSHVIITHPEWSKEDLAEAARLLLKHGAYSQDRPFGLQTDNPGPGADLGLSYRGADLPEYFIYEASSKVGKQLGQILFEARIRARAGTNPSTAAKETMMSKIKLGSVVVLRSSGPEMTVTAVPTDVGNTSVEVSWFQQARFDECGCSEAKSDPVYGSIQTAWLSTDTLDFVR
jgi:uncharacterized protein YodC (DUF2158 family)